MKNKPSKEPAPEKDFWDLGDDDLDLEGVPKPEEKKKAIPPPKEREPEAPAAPIPMKEEEVPEEEEQEEPAQEEDEKEPAEPARQRVVVTEKPTTILEKAAIFIFFACLLGAGAWGIANYYSQAPEGTLLTVTEDFPVEGEYLTVEETETWWRTPIRSGKNADRGIQLAAKLIPCVRLRISGNKSGTVRYAFRNEKDQIVGDSPTLVVKDGKFDSTGTDEITLNCSGGFRNASLINSYVNGDIDPWIFQIFEAPAGETPDKDSEPLVKSFIQATYKESETDEENE